MAMRFDGDERFSLKCVGGTVGIWRVKNSRNDDSGGCLG